MRFGHEYRFLIGLIGIMFSVHGATWLTISVMVGREIGESIWLAPNVIVSKTVFYAMTFTCLAIYTAVLATVNLLSDESPIR